MNKFVKSTDISGKNQGMGTKELKERGMIGKVLVTSKQIYEDRKN